MAHPQMFDSDDPYLQRLREVCLGLPGAEEKVSHGRPNFFTRKVFAVYGGVIRGDHDPEPYGRSVLFLPEEAERPALVEDERIFLPAYYGPYGWLGLNFRHASGVGAVDWTEVAELVESSFRLTAPKALVKELDARS